MSERNIQSRNPEEPYSYEEDVDKAYAMAHGEAPERELSLTAKRIGEHAVSVIEISGPKTIISKRESRKAGGVTLKDRLTSEIIEQGMGTSTNKIRIAENLAGEAGKTAQEARYQAGYRLSLAKEQGEKAGKIYEDTTSIKNALEKIK